MRSVAIGCAQAVTVAGLRAGPFTPIHTWAICLPRPGGRRVPAAMGRRATVLAAHESAKWDARVQDAAQAGSPGCRAGYKTQGRGPPALLTRPFLRCRLHWQRLSELSDVLFSQPQPYYY